MSLIAPRFGELRVDEDSIRNWHLNEYDPKRIIAGFDRSFLHVPTQDKFRKLEDLGMDVEVSAALLYWDPSQTEEVGGTFGPSFLVKFLNNKTQQQLMEFAMDAKSTVGEIITAIFSTAWQCIEVNPTNATATLKASPDNTRKPGSGRH